MNNIRIIDGDFIPASEYDSVICEGDGSYNKDQWVSIKIGDVGVGTEFIIDIDFSQEIVGKITIDHGDYWTPPSTDIDIVKNNIEIKSISINEMDIPVNNFLRDVCVDLIKKVV